MTLNSFGQDAQWEDSPDLTPEPSTIAAWSVKVRFRASDKDQTNVREIVVDVPVNPGEYLQNMRLEVDRMTIVHLPFHIHGESRIHTICRKYGVGDPDEVRTVEW